MKSQRFIIHTNERIEYAEVDLCGFAFQAAQQSYVRLSQLSLFNYL